MCHTLYQHAADPSPRKQSRILHISDSKDGLPPDAYNYKTYEWQPEHTKRHELTDAESSVGFDFFWIINGSASDCIRFFNRLAQTLDIGVSLQFDTYSHEYYPWEG